MEMSGLCNHIQRNDKKTKIRKITETTVVETFKFFQHFFPNDIKGTTRGINNFNLKFLIEFLTEQWISGGK